MSNRSTFSNAQLRHIHRFKRKTAPVGVALLLWSAMAVAVIAWLR